MEGPAKGLSASPKGGENDDEGSVVVEFKRRPTRPRGGQVGKPSLLQRAEEKDDKEHDEEEEVPLGLMLRETRKAQRERERVKGTEAAATSSEVLKKIAMISTVRPTASDDDDSDKHLLASTFTMEAEESVVNPLLESYIEEKLKEIRDKKAQEAIERAKAERGADWQAYPQGGEEKKEFDLREEERKLYETPDHLKVNQTTRIDDQVSEAWLTGIQEIELPIEYKLKNIEATEEAKQSMLKRKQEVKEPSQQDTYNTRFGRPSTTTQIVRKERSNPRRDDNGERSDGRWRDEHRMKKSDQATDNITFERFKKRFRR